MYSVLIIFITITISYHVTGSNSPLQPAIDGFMINFLKYNSNSKPNQNIFFSPLSIEVAYTFLMGGAQGKTQEQMKRALGFNYIEDKTKIKPEEIIKEFKELSNHYTKDTPELSLLSANLLAVSKDFDVKPQFKNIARQFNAKVETENFEKGPSTMKKINTWISNNTKNMIPDFLKEPPPKETCMMILNAVYLKGKWNEPFNVNRTKPDKFKNSDGSTAEVPMMSTKRKRFSFSRKSDFQILEIPYKNSVSMFILLPNKGGKIQKILDALKPESLDGELNSLKDLKFDSISVPKFKIDHNVDLKKVLQKMGMKHAFSNEADFSKISTRSIKVTKSTHIAKIEVDEEGTRASAVTDIEMEELSGGSLKKLEFIVDRPFMFLIRDKTKAVTMFAGIINKL